MTKKNTEIPVNEKLKNLYKLQKIDSRIDEIRRLRGELPLKVQDLEDEIVGLKTRETNFLQDIEKLENQIKEKKEQIVNANALIKKYNEQQKNVRNNREFDALRKETEYQTLDIELSEKRIVEYEKTLEERRKDIEQLLVSIKDKSEELNEAQVELKSIVEETKKDEEELLNESEQVSKEVEDRLLTAYKRIRGAMRNGLAVVTVDRDACGGCFNKLPPQRQLDVASSKKIIVCEFCGRILIDNEIVNEVLGIKTEDDPK